MTWYAFTVPPKLERRAWDGLEKIHVEPARLQVAYRVRSREGRFLGKRLVQMVPMIPGYAIANVTGPIPWPLIRMIEWNGKPVIRVVLRSGGAPRAIPAAEVERLAAYLSETDHTGPGTLRPGARARVSIGRHDDRETVIQRVLSEARCTVMMRWFGAEREVQTTVERLREAG